MEHILTTYLYILLGLIVDLLFHIVDTLLSRVGVVFDLHILKASILYDLHSKMIIFVLCVFFLLHFSFTFGGPHNIPSQNHTYLLILCPTDNPEKRQALRTSWLNLQYLPPGVVSYRFISDNITQADMLAGDTIKTHADDKVSNSKGLLGGFFPKMRTSFRYAIEHPHFSYILWVDDDTIPNITRFLSVIIEYDRNSKKEDSKGLYMGVAIRNMPNNPAWNPDYETYTSLRNYPVFMHGSAIVFGSGIFKALGFVDHHIGLRFFGNGDTTIGIWLSGFHIDLKSFQDKFVIDANPISMNSLLSVDDLNAFCEPLYYHNLKHVEHLLIFGPAFSEKCSKRLFNSDSVLQEKILDVSKKMSILSLSANGERV